jgi:hypothetical protein
MEHVLNKLAKLNGLQTAAETEAAYLQKRDTPYRRTRLRSVLLEIKKLSEDLREELL